MVQQVLQNAIYQNLEYMESFNPDYVLILSGDHIYKMDYESPAGFPQGEQCGGNDCGYAGAYGGGKPFRYYDCG